MAYIESNFECSKTLPRNAGELTDRTKIRSKNRREFGAARIIAQMFASKVQASRIIARTFTWNEKIGVKFHRFIAAISL